MTYEKCAKQLRAYQISLGGCLSRLDIQNLVIFIDAHFHGHPNDPNVVRIVGRGFSTHFKFK